MEAALASKIVDTLSDGIVIHDVDTGKIRDVNQTFLEMHEYDRDDLIGHDVDIISADHPDYSLDDATHRIEQAREEGPVHFEWQNKRADGTVFPVEVELTPVTLETTECIVATVREITDRKERERELTELTTRLEIALEGTTTGIWEWNITTDEVIWDGQVEQLFGYDPGEFDGTPEGFRSRVHPDDVDDVEAAYEQGIEDGFYDAEFRVYIEGQTERWVRARGQVVYEDDDPVNMIGVITDITERKEYEQALEQTRDELRQIIDLIPDPIYVKNRDGEILLTNEANAALLGSPREEITGKLESDFFPPSDHYETLHQRDIDVIDSGESTVFEEELNSADGDRYVFQTTRIPFDTARSDGVAVLGYARDVTDLKDYEQELETQLENLEILNHVLRHDIRNDLQVVTAYADFLEDKCEREEELEYIHTLQQNANHAVELTETARELADIMLSVTNEEQQINLETVLTKEVSEVQASYPEAVVTYETAIPSVQILATEMISSVFRNLLKNAIQHNDKQLCEVTVSATEHDETVIIRIADNGPGISDDRKESIFGQGERGLDSSGTGMGLYLVKTLVTGHGGDVWIEANNPEGTVFIVELPKSG